MPPAAKTLFGNLLAVLLHGVRMRSVQIRLRRSLRGFWIPKNFWTGNFIVCFDLLANGRISAFTVGPCPLGCSENGILFKVLIRNWYKNKKTPFVSGRKDAVPPDFVFSASRKDAP